MQRRRFLVGLGGITVGLPMLRAFIDPRAARAGGPAPGMPKRIIMMAYGQGTHLPQFVTSSTGASPNLGTITEPMEAFKDRALFVSNCPNAVLDLGGSGFVFGHPGKKEAVLTGTLTTAAFGGNGANVIGNVFQTSPGNSKTPNGPSVETVIGQFLQTSEHLRPSVDLGVWGPGGARTGEVSDFFYEGPSNPVSVEAHPGRAFASIFAGVQPSTGEVDEALQALRRRKKSVLDGVRESFVDLRQGLNAQDRATLDDHADKIRQIELDVPPSLGCEIPDGIPEPDAAYAGMSMMELGTYQNRIMAHAMACGVAPVGRIEYLKQERPYFGVPVVDDAIAPLQFNAWHEPIVHGTDGFSKGSAPRVAGFRFFVEKLAELCGLLDEIVEGPDGETVFDNSLIVLASDLGEGNAHNARDLCFIVAGNSGPGRRNYHLEASGYNTNRFLNSLLHMAGVTNDQGAPVDEFGLGGFAPGPIAELLG